jgi:hypothetical protein
VLNAVSASFASTASFVTLAQTASFVATASWARNAVTASYITGSVFNSTNPALSASYALTASYVKQAESASFALTSSYAINMVISGGLTDVDYIDFDRTSSAALQDARLKWDEGEGTLQLGLKGGVDANIGEQLYQYVYNAEATTLTKATVVYVSGSQGGRIAVKRASATSEGLSAETLGLAAEDITAGSEGWVITDGSLRGVNTSGLIGGRLIFLSSSAGQYTQEYPQAPLHGVRLGYVQKVDANPNQGILYIKIDNGYELDELHDVRINGATSGDLLIRSASVWINTKQLEGSYQLTGSFSISGSTTQVGNNTLLGNTSLSGSLTVSGSQGSTNPTIQIYGDIRQTGYHRFDPVTTNIDSSISASYIYVSGSTNDLYFTQNSAGYANTTRLRWLEGNLYTGLLHGGVISATIGSNAYTISSGSGIIVDLNASIDDDPYPVVQYLNWSNLNGTIDALSGSNDQSFVAILSDGTIGAQGTPYSNGDYNDKIPIGIVIHQNRSTINAFQTFPGVAYGWKQRSYDFIRAFGPLKISGYTLAASGSSTGSLVLSGGTSWVDGRNYTIDPNQPSYIQEASGITTSKIFRYRQSGSDFVYDTNAGAGYATIDPGNYSNNGVLTPVSSNNWTIQRVFYFPNSPTKALFVYYGNAEYANEAAALAAVGTEPFTEAPNTAANAIYVGYMILRNNANFTVAASYEFYQASLFRAAGAGGGGGGGGATALVALTDVSITSPTDYQPFAYNSVTTKWENRSTISASLKGNADTATTASHALTASSADAFTVRRYVELQPGSDPGTANVSASYLFVTSSSDDTGFNLHYRNNGALWETHWLEERTDTGIVWGGVLTFNSTTMSITPGAGLIVNHNASTSSHGDTVATYVPFGPITASATFITSSQVTYLLIDENGQLVQQTTQFTPEQYNEKFPLGYIFCLTTSSISSYADARITTYGQTEQGGEFIRAFGPLKLSGYDISPQSGSLKISIASGQAYRYGGFYSQNPDYPSQYNSTAVATGSLVRIYRDPAVVGGFRAATNAGVPYTDIDPTKWDNGSGTLQTVSASQWSIQRVFEGVVNNISYVYYGQNVYDSLALALQSITTDEFVESPTSILALPFIGYIIAKGDATNLADTTNNRIIQAGLFRNTAGSSGGGGAAAQSLDDLSDVTITGPVNGQALIYNAGLWVNGTPQNANFATTASYVLQAVSSSFATTASYVLQSVSASFATNAATASFVTLAQTASFVATASWARNAITASFVTTAQTASYVLQAVSASFATNAATASFVILAQTASYVLNAVSSSFSTNAATASSVGNLTQNVTITGSLFVSNSIVLTTSGSITAVSGSIRAMSITGSLLGTSSWAQNSVTASYILNAVSASFASTASFVTLAQTASYVLQAVSASFATNAATASFVATASWANNAVTASYVKNAESASYVLNAVSASFATNAATASFVTLAQSASYVLQAVSASFATNAATASFVATASWAQNAVTASYVTGSVFSSSNPALSASYALTASFALNAGASTTITVADEGTAQGTATFLNFIGAGVTALVSANTASITISGGSGATFPYTGSAIISGSLVVTGSTTSTFGFTGSLLGTSSWANNAVTASYYQVFPYTGSAQITGSLGMTGSISMGERLGAGAIYSLTMGSASLASGFSSVAIGREVTASGIGAVAIGFGRNGVFSASGDYSVAFGYAGDDDLYASGYGSFAHGDGVSAIGSASHAEGQGSTALGSNSHAEGYYCFASSSFSHAEGNDTRARGLYAHTEGEFNTANARGSHAEGTGTETSALAFDSHAEGFGSITSASYSHAEGFDTITRGESSHAEGEYTLTIGKASHAEGRFTSASGLYSHAEGSASWTRGAASHAEGWGTVTSGSYQLTVGQWNFSSSAQSAFIIGNGTSDSARSNLVFASGSQVQVTGSVIASAGFTGSLFGTASFAVSASWAPGGSGGLTTKAGSVANTSFAGNPRKATVTFGTAFANTSYAIVITGEDSRAWSIESKAVGSFVINANSNVGLAGTTYWIATAYGETA